MNLAVVDAARLLEIIGVNIVLSGDNAVAVGMAIRNLPAAQQKFVSAIGIGLAALLQTIATLTVARLLTLPVVSLAGGLLVCAIAVRLLHNNASLADPAGQGHSGQGLLHSIMIVTVTYFVMCPDNILAIAAVGRGHPWLLILGLLLSSVLILVASLVIASLIKRYPVTLIVAAAILGWVAGSMLAAGAVQMGRLLTGRITELVIPAVMTVIVVTSPWWWRCRREELR